MKSMFFQGTNDVWFPELKMEHFLPRKDLALEITNMRLNEIHIFNVCTFFHF